MSVPAQRPLDGLTILVVDDHQDSVDMLQEYLGSVGARAIGAESAKTALSITQTVQLDAVLVDLRMPGEDGRWFLRELRRSRVVGAATLPVYTISGERHDRPEPESGFAGYFLKPVDFDALVAVLQPLPRRSG